MRLFDTLLWACFNNFAHLNIRTLSDACLYFVHRSNCPMFLFLGVEKKKEKKSNIFLLFELFLLYKLDDNEDTKLGLIDSR